MKSKEFYIVIIGNIIRGDAPQGLLKDLSKSYEITVNCFYTYSKIYCKV
ncbi:MAG: hypothetical protein ABIM62_05290 [candidate division WOR-3 bacterium]